MFLKTFRWISAFWLAVTIIFPLNNVFAQGNSPDGAVYVVQPGDTLSGIAFFFRVDLQSLIVENSLSNPDALQVGMRLKIPGLEEFQGEFVPQTVVFGDSLIEQARSLATPLDLLIQVNHIVSPEQVLAGEDIVFLKTKDSTTTSNAGHWSLSSGEDFLSAAVLLGVNPWSLALENQLAGTWAAIPGDVFLTSQSSIPDALTGIPSKGLQINLKPIELVQGTTAVISVNGLYGGDLSGTLDDFNLKFYSQGQGSWVALAGIPAMAAPGGVSLRIRAQFADGSVYVFEQNVLLKAGNYGRESIQVDPMLIDPDVNQQEMTTLMAVMSQPSDQKLWDGIFVSPSPYPDCLNSTYGTRRSYNGKPYNAFHSGLDFCGGTGTRIFAAAAGKVVFAGPLTVRGNATIIDHGWGVFTGYWHQSESYVQVGDIVTPGQLIGRVGGTGRVTGPHLHWEVWVGGVQVDPFEWMTSSFP